MKQWVGLVARLIVGGILVVAGLSKFSDPAGNVRAVRAYRILPESVVPTVGHALPTIEIVIGALLILGLFTRIPAAMLAVVMRASLAKHLPVLCGHSPAFATLDAPFSLRCALPKSRP